ncbi:MAG: tetratricopeptide repeat protein [Alphaproteobacteria bacterium]|nr:tetratricopeptide repeat protein [Alphaproteobacteria bacterium]
MTNNPVNNNVVTHEEALKIARQHHETGNLTLADKTYRDILKVVPDDYTSLHYLGILCYQQGNPAEAVHLLKQAIGIDSTHADTWNAYAVVLEQTGQADKALEAWDKALELTPEYPEALSNKGNALWSLGHYEEAEKTCQKAVDIRPEFADAYINLGNAIASQDRKEEAIEIWEKAIELKSANYNAYINIGNALRDLGRIKESEEKCRRALEFAPDHPDALLNLGNALRDLGQRQEAEKLYRKSIEVRPDYAKAHNNLAILLMDMLRFEDAVASTKYAVAFAPDYAEAYANMSAALLELGKLEEAEKSARKALLLDPDSTEARIDLADILFMSDRLDEAETLFNEATDLKPDSPRLFIKLSAVLERANRMDEALEAIEKAVELNPEMPEAYHRQAMVYFMFNHIEEALKSLDRALEIQPRYPAALATKSEILQSSGNMEKAKEAARAGLEMNDKMPFLYLSLSKVKKFTEDDPDFLKMKEMENESNFGSAQKVSLYFSLFKACEDIGDYDQAFEHLRKGCDLKRQTVVFDPQTQQHVYQNIQKVYTLEFIESFEGKGHDSDTPIFIVGMPRSGTTLTEQIISSHPDIFGAGELHYLSAVEKKHGFINADNCRKMGEDYVAMTRAIDEGSKTARKITDKMPGNYMRMGQMVASLPNAKIIHCRRNPIDTCLSCYKQLFARGHYWSYNLEELAEHYALYMQMMDHWRKTLPEGRFLEIDYETTVNDFENQARKLLDFVEMEWHDACLTPHKTKRSVLTASKGQVIKPIYKTSVEAWRRYETQLQPLAEKLEKFAQK